MESLVSTDWLADHLGDPALTIVDSSWHMPATNRNGRVANRIDVEEDGAGNVRLEKLVAAIAPGRGHVPA